MNYKDLSIDFEIARYEEGVAIVPLPDGQILCIPEQDATAEELDIIRQIKEDVAGRPTVEAPVVEPMPTESERIAALEAAMLEFIMGGVL